jgi:hypothetical protein
VSLGVLGVPKLRVLGRVHRGIAAFRTCGGRPYFYHYSPLHVRGGVNYHRVCYLLVGPRKIGAWWLQSSHTSLA